MCCEGWLFKGEGINGEAIQHFPISRVQAVMWAVVYKLHDYAGRLYLFHLADEETEVETN